MENPAFARHVFEIIAQALFSNPKFPAVVKTEKSFEQWINMEAYLACTEAGHKCEPEWRFDKYNRADLYVESESGLAKVLVETKLVGDSTRNKYLNSIKDDYFRLALQADPPGGATVGLQILVMYSMHGDIIGRESWMPWIGPESQYTPWRFGTDLKRNLEIAQNGYVHIWGWPINKSDYEKLKPLAPAEGGMK
jgi:hypothetical protein